LIAIELKRDSGDFANLASPNHLEDTGVFTWVNRIDCMAERTQNLFGHWVKEYRIVCRSNVSPMAQNFCSKKLLINCLTNQEHALCL
jgi:hypothetical protein